MRHRHRRRGHPSWWREWEQKNATQSVSRMPISHTRKECQLKCLRATRQKGLQLAFAYRQIWLADNNVHYATNVGKDLCSIQTEIAFVFLYVDSSINSVEFNCISGAKLAGYSDRRVLPSDWCQMVKLSDCPSVRTKFKGCGQRSKGK